jgi:hypothetical protein
MGYASFTNSPASTRVPAQSVADGRRVGRSRLTALLVVAAGHRIPTSSGFGFFRSRPHRAPAVFPDPDAAPAHASMERRLLRILPLEDLRRLVARDCHNPSRVCTRELCFSSLQPAIASGLIDTRRIISSFFRRHNVKPWHYRLGSGQRLPWRHRYPRQDAAPCGA